MKKALTDLRDRYKSNPALCWLYFTVFVFFLLPEYVSPFIMVIAFIVFKHQWRKEGRLAKVGNLGKFEMIFMAYMAVSFLWSKTKLDSLGTAGMWWLVFIMQVMIYNLARTREKIEGVIKALVASAAVNGFVGLLQMISYILYINKKITINQLIVTPAYKNLDIKVYSALPFKISTKMWVQRASGFFSNPNLLATFMIVGFALGVHLMLSAKTKNKKIFYFIELAFISAGMASTMTRAGCYILLAEWLILFVIFFKRHKGAMLALFVPTAGTTIPSILIRYGKLRITTQPYIYTGEAYQSSAMHFQIWKSLFDYIFKHVGVLIFGTGFGCEYTGKILLTYHLNKPHAHNFIIEIWVELGMIGLVMLLAIIIRAAGKLVEIELKDNDTITLVICILMAFGSYFVFGLSDFIFNSPKQIVFFMLLIGLIQALSYISDKKEIHTTKDLGRIASRDVKKIINQ